MTKTKIERLQEKSKKRFNSPLSAAAWGWSIPWPIGRLPTSWWVRRSRCRRCRRCWRSNFSRRRFYFSSGKSLGSWCWLTETRCSTGFFKKTDAGNFLFLPGTRLNFFFIQRLKALINWNGFGIGGLQLIKATPHLNELNFTQIQTLVWNVVSVKIQFMVSHGNNFFDKLFRK